MNIIQRLQEIERQIRTNRIISGKGISATPSMMGTVVDADDVSAKADSGDLLRKVSFGTFFSSDPYSELLLGQEGDGPSVVVNAGTIYLGNSAYGISAVAMPLSTFPQTGFSEIRAFLQYNNGTFSKGICATNNESYPVPSGGTIYFKRIASIWPSFPGAIYERYHFGDIEIMNRWSV